MGGVTVFPGGGVSRADLDPRWERASALDRAEAARLLGDLPGAEALGALVAGLRESYEEVGFVIGSDVGGLGRPASDDPEGFLERCLDAGAVLATDRLMPAGRWITPNGFPLRFDTRFFLAEAPAGWDPDPNPDEVESCRWSTPGAALEDVRQGRARMAPPTIAMLQRLSGFDDVAWALAAIRVDDGNTGVIMTQRLSDGISVVLAPNPGLMTGPGTNTYVVGGPPATVIDPAVDDGAYLDEVAAAAGEVAQILVTHRHPDHVGGVAALVARTGAPVRAFRADEAGGVPVASLADGEAIPAGGLDLRALHTPGHASDHLCFVVEATGELFAGDNVLGQGTAVIAPPDGDMAAYLESLHRMRSLEPTRIYPGHFPPVEDAVGTIDRYMAHRAERERKVLAALESGARDLDAIVARAYDDTPVELHGIARQSALAHLIALESDGRAARAGNRWRLM
jgi:glyoxylase-like metal-dependent hydrolase (beta-lactamase superfamily II)/8-oxo-dGTP pyrophosphatase MutT (NUDIX family)